MSCCDVDARRYCDEARTLARLVRRGEMLAHEQLDPIPLASALADLATHLGLDRASTLIAKEAIGGHVGARSGVST